MTKAISKVNRPVWSLQSLSWRSSSALVWCTHRQRRKASQIRKTLAVKLLQVGKLLRLGIHSMELSNRDLQKSAIISGVQRIADLPHPNKGGLHEGWTDSESPYQQGIVAGTQRHRWISMQWSRRLDAAYQQWMAGRSLGIRSAQRGVIRKDAYTHPLEYGERVHFVPNLQHVSDRRIKQFPHAPCMKLELVARCTASCVEAGIGSMLSE